jgi:hypothetical protein
MAPVKYEHFRLTHFYGPVKGMLLESVGYEQNYL